MLRLTRKTAGLAAGCMGFSLWCASTQGALLTDSAGTVGLWHMDTAPGGVVPDDDSLNAGRDNDLTLNGGATLTAGLDGDAASFNGTTSYAISDDVFAPSEFIHAVVYFKFNALPTTDNHILNAGPLFRLSVLAGNPRLVLEGTNGGSSDRIRTASGSITADDWFKAELTILEGGEDNATLVLTNLTTLAESSITGTLVADWSTPRNIMVGAFNSSGSPLAGTFFDGLVDDVRVTTAPIPEPASMALLGLAALTLLRRR